MYVTLEEFERHILKYMALAKSVDVYIVDAGKNTVWILRCQRESIRARIAHMIQDASSRGLHPASIKSSFNTDIFHPECLEPLRMVFINVACHTVTGHNF